MFHFGEFELYSSDVGDVVLAPLSSEEVAWDVDDLNETLGDAKLWLENETPGMRRSAAAWRARHHPQR